MNIWAMLILETAVLWGSAKTVRSAGGAFGVEGVTEKGKGCRVE